MAKNTTTKLISVYFKEEELDLIKRASKISGLNYSAFCRTIVLERAREILKENEAIS